PKSLSLTWHPQQPLVPLRQALHYYQAQPSSLCFPDSALSKRPAPVSSPPRQHVLHTSQSRAWSRRLSPDPSENRDSYALPDAELRQWHPDSGYRSDRPEAPCSCKYYMGNQSPDGHTAPAPRRTFLSRAHKLPWNQTAAA